MVPRIKSGVMIKVGMSGKTQKNIMHVKKFIFGILAHVFVRMGNI